MGAVSFRKIQIGLFYLLIILLPSQLGRHFWPEFAFVSGVRVDYLSPTLYLTDLLVLGILVLEVPKLARAINGKFLIGLSVVGILAIINTQTSLSPAVSAYKWVKVFELVFLAYFVAKNFKRRMAVWFLVPIFYESVIVLWQFMTQGSIGGWWWFLGERTFYSGTPGIANTIIYGQLVLRPYGTLPHPNVVAGFFAIVLPLVIGYFPHKFRKITAAILSFGLAALCMTLSRSAIVVGVLALGVALGIRKGKLALLFGGAILVLIGGAFAFWQFREEVEPVVARREMALVAIQKWTDSPIFGAGLGTAPLFRTPNVNFALRQQPVHNIYLVALSELGLLGLLCLVGIMGFAIYRAIKARNWPGAVALGSIGALGLVDHYFLTVQQGQLLLALVIGLCFARIRE